METEEKSRRRFFDGGEPALPAPYNQPRAMTAAAEIIDLNLQKTAAVRSPEAWQEAAWNYIDIVGELKYAFGLISQIVSRALLYAAIDEDSSEVPIDATEFLRTTDQAKEDGEKSDTARAAEAADEAMLEIQITGQSEILRLLALNLAVAGECYFVKHKEKYIVASVSEYRAGDPPTLKQSRRDASQGLTLDKSTYAARIYRAHPRYSKDADSSVLGVLDQIEKVVLFDQTMRAIARSRLGAGAIYIPTGITPLGEKPLDEALIEVTQRPVEDEASGFTVTPLLLQGPNEVGDKIKRIELERKIDEELLAASSDAIDRMLAGLDIPKNIVSGLADVRYSNALVIDDSLYKAHIEPMIMLICDALTTAYLRPKMLKAGIDEKLVNRFVVWYNPSQIVTRPDRSQSANEGYERFLISGEAWRRARGYSDLDKPSEDEIIKRIALERVQVPQDMAATMIEALNPIFFASKRAENQRAAGVPDDVSSLLNGEIPGQAPSERPADVAESPSRTAEASGGELTPGGSMPTRGQT